MNVLTAAIDASTMTLDQIMAVLQLSTNLPRFKCRHCGRHHSYGWRRCYEQIGAPFADLSLACNRAFIHAATLYAEELDGGTLLHLPAVRVSIPRVIPYKVVFYKQEEALSLLEQYVEIRNAIPEPPPITLFEKRVPLSLMLTPQQYRELVCRLMDSPAYNEYTEWLKSFVQQVVNFVTAHPVLFVPSVPVQTKLWFGRQCSGIPGPFMPDVYVLPSGHDQPLSLNSIFSRLDVLSAHLVRAVYSFHDFGFLDPPRAAVLNGMLLLSPAGTHEYTDAQYLCKTTLLPLVNGFQFSFRVNTLSKNGPLNHIDCSDGITARLSALCHELDAITRPAFKAMFRTYLADMGRAICAKEVQSCNPPLPL